MCLDDSYAIDELQVVVHGDGKLDAGDIYYVATRVAPKRVRFWNRWRRSKDAHFEK